MSAGPTEVAPGLWRWSVPHPDWRPDAVPGSYGDWPREVGCVLHETDEQAVFFDPLIDSDALWEWVDDRCAGKRVTVLTTIGWHRRSRPELVERYSASTSRSKANLPRGVEPFVVPGAGETIFWIPEHRALITGDRIIGAAGGGLRLCPVSWMRYLKTPLTGEQLRARLLGLLALPVERVLVSHGGPVLSGGSQALAQILGPS
jgi:hypothetical protein